MSAFDLVSPQEAYDQSVAAVMSAPLPGINIAPTVAGSRKPISEWAAYVKQHSKAINEMYGSEIAAMKASGKKGAFFHHAKLHALNNGFKFKSSEERAAARAQSLARLKAGRASGKYKPKKKSVPKALKKEMKGLGKMSKKDLIKLIKERPRVVAVAKRVAKPKKAKAGKKVKAPRKKNIAKANMAKKLLAKLYPQKIRIPGTRAPPSAKKAKSVQVNRQPVFVFTGGQMAAALKKAKGKEREVSTDSPPKRKSPSGKSPKRSPKTPSFTKASLSAAQQKEIMGLLGLS